MLQRLLLLAKDADRQTSSYLQPGDLSTLFYCRHEGQGAVGRHLYYV